jgi:hypothetical protein
MEADMATKKQPKRHKRVSTASKPKQTGKLPTKEVPISDLPDAGQAPTDHAPIEGERPQR